MHGTYIGKKWRKTLLFLIMIGSQTHRSYHRFESPLPRLPHSPLIFFFHPFTIFRYKAFSEDMITKLNQISITLEEASSIRLL